MSQTSVEMYRQVAEQALHAGDLNDAPERMMNSVLGVFVRDSDTYQYSEVGKVVDALDGLGFFRFRNAVYDLADALGVSRVTIYKYLNGK
jgi:predicted transcriptional regulator YheO